MDNRRNLRGILPLAGLATALYAGLAFAGDLTSRLSLYLAAHLILVVVMLVALRLVARGDDRVRRAALAGALLFRVVMAAGEPVLSDDVYRYVWDGRLQLHGIHPYRHAPAAPELQEFRDDIWAKINHPEVPTIYPPLAQILFLGLAALGAGPGGFKLAAGLLDFGVVLALAHLLRRRSLPAHRVILYAWNPLAVVESAGSGHYDPIGVALVVLAAAWIIEGRQGLSTLAVAGAVQAKLLPAVLIPGYLRRWRVWAVVTFAVAVVLPAVPYAVTGPSVGPGLVEYAERWERNALAFSAVREAYAAVDLAPSLTGAITRLKSRWGEDVFDWDWLYRHVWPTHLARGTMLLLAVAWLLWLAFRKPPDAARESFLSLAGILLLAPTLHPWYLLWVLPFAAGFRSRGWILLAALVPLSYLGGDGDVPWVVRLVEYVPPLGWMAWDAARARRLDRPGGSMRG